MTVVIDGSARRLKRVLAYEAQAGDIMPVHGHWFVVTGVTTTVRQVGGRRTEVQLAYLDGTPCDLPFGATGEVSVAVLREVAN